MKKVYLMYNLFERIIGMSARNNKLNKKSSKNTTFITSGVIIDASLLFVYFMFNTVPAEKMEEVKIIAITEAEILLKP